MPPSVVVNLYVEDGVVVRLVAERANVTLNTTVCARVDHGRRAHGLSIPAEKTREEVRGLDTVAAADFEVNHRLSHRNFNSRDREMIAQTKQERVLSGIAGQAQEPGQTIGPPCSPHSYTKVIRPSGMSALFRV